MAIPLDKNPTAQNPANAPKMSDDKDTELATRMCIQMLQEKGLPVIQSAIKSSKDPAQVIGQFIGQMFGMVAEKLQNMGVDPSVFLKKGGVLTAVLNYLRDKLGLNPQQMNAIYVEVLNMVKAGAGGGQKQEGQQPMDQEEAGEDQQEEATESPEQEAQEPEPQGGNY